MRPGIGGDTGHHGDMAGDNRPGEPGSQPFDEGDPVHARLLKWDWRLLLAHCQTTAFAKRFQKGIEKLPTTFSTLSDAYLCFQLRGAIEETKSFLR
jgi:hypothetical protein